MISENNFTGSDSPSSEPPTTHENAAPPNSFELSTFKQFLFLRKDLKDFSEGGLVAQGSHASVAAIYKTLSHPDTIRYLKDTHILTTIVYGITKNEIESVIKKLNDMGIEHALWIENGEEPTCIGTRPIDVSKHPEFQNFRKKFRLFKR